MTRKGKIARLPRDIREQVNLRLQNGEESKQVVEWLNALPEVRDIMAAEFNGQRINEANLSRWKSGGFGDWELQMEARETVRQFSTDASELSQATGAPLADQLAVCVTARIAMALRQVTRHENNPLIQLKLLRKVCADVAALRRGDQNAQWLEIERARLNLKAGASHPAPSSPAAQTPSDDLFDLSGVIP